MSDHLARKILDGTFSLDDLADQLRKLKKLGAIRDVLKMTPGIGNRLDDLGFDRQDLDKIEAIIQSMTPEERARPESLDAGQRDRIAKGSGAARADVDDIIKQFGKMKQLMEQMGRMGPKEPL
jgi:signal recognition particle subunit SRP54